MMNNKKVALVTGGTIGIELGTIEFLLSDKSLWTTRATYFVDGGKSI